MRHTKRAGKGRFLFKGVLLSAAIVFVLLLLMLSPLFTVHTVHIEGNTVVKAEEILKTTGLDADVNIFSVMSHQAAQALEALPYIQRARIVKDFPDTINITVTERKARGYVEYSRMNTYLLIDGEGMVLGTQSAMTDKLPVIVGLSFTDFAVGRLLETDNPDAFDTVVTLSQLFVKNELADIVKVDVSDSRDIHLYLRNVDIFFGSMDDADLKVQTLKALAPNLPAEDRGFLHMEDINKDPVFQFLK